MGYPGQSLLGLAAGKRSVCGSLAAGCELVLSPRHPANAESALQCWNRSRPPNDLRKSRGLGRADRISTSPREEAFASRGAQRKDLRWRPPRGLRPGGGVFTSTATEFIAPGRKRPVTSTSIGARTSGCPRRWLCFASKRRITPLTRVEHAIGPFHGGLELGVVDRYRVDQAWWLAEDRLP